MTAELFLLCVLAAIAGAPFGHLAALALIRGYEWTEDRFFPGKAGIVRIAFVPTITDAQIRRRYPQL